MWTLITALAFAAPEPMVVPAGLYTFGQREVYLHGFSIEALHGPEQRCNTEPLSHPTRDEWLAAAQQPAFIHSGKWEQLDAPSSDMCDELMGVVEAEGVGGWIWFAGWAGHLGESQVMEGKDDPKTGIIRIHANPWHFWGEESKPAPRAERCVVHREPVSPEPKYVDASSLNMRAGRSTDFGIVHKAWAGAAVTPLHTDGDWVFIEAPRRQWDDSGTEPEWHTCTMRGWVMHKFLADAKPEAKPYVLEAEAALAAGKLKGSLAPIERAAALHAENIVLREGLADAYEAVKSEHAESVRSQATALRKKYPTKAWSIEEEGLQLATWCKDKPDDEEVWTKLGPSTMDGCALPWAEAGGVYTKDARGWVDLDQSDLGSQCGDDPIRAIDKAARVKPETLHIRVAGVDQEATRAIHVRVRDVLGEHMDGEYNHTGFGPWRTVLLQDGIGKDGVVTSAPMADVLGKTDRAVQVHVEIYGTDGEQIDTVVRELDILWPVSC